MPNRENITLGKNCLEFIKLGAAAFGGLGVFLPLLKRNAVEIGGWMTLDEMTETVSIAQCMPGVVMVNTAMNWGMRKFGPLGAALCGMSVALPSVVAITAIGLFLKSAASVNAALSGVYQGIRLAVVASGIRAFFNMVRRNVKNAFGLIVTLCAIVALFVFRVKTVAVVASAILIGFVYHFFCVLFVNKNALGKGEK